jgi:zinc finger protein 830
VAPQQDQGAVDEDEWAAFEADIAAVTATYDDSAVVASAAAMTAEEAILAAAAKREEEDGDNGEQRVPGHRALQEERDDAARTFEEELDEMQALEARLRRLKERREALRRGEEEVPEVVKHDATPLEGAEGQGVEEMAAAAGGENEDDEDDDDDDDEDLEDDWNGFRIRR